MSQEMLEKVVKITARTDGTRDEEGTVTVQIVKSSTQQPESIQIVTFTQE